MVEDSVGDTAPPTSPGNVLPSRVASMIAGGEWQRLAPYPISEEDAHKELPLGPEGLLDHGVLPNGMRFYVRTNAKPKGRAALALALRVGSLAEEEDERGCAHICEHLAFNATERFDNHAIVHFLEMIGAAFGPCQNAYTSADETVYELLVPLDKGGLKQGLEVLSEFACKTRIAPGDLEKERGAVLEEWRQGRDSRGRAFDAWWKARGSTEVLYGNESRYAERLPIGLEKVIRTASADVVKGFYQKWYRPEHMAIVCVGDFPDRAAVVDMVREAFAGVASHPSPAPPLVRAAHVPHSAPRFLAYVEKELTDSSLTITYKRAAQPVNTIARYRQQLTEDIFCSALSHRLFKLSRRPNPVFYSSACQCDDPVSAVNVFFLDVQTPEGKVVPALEAVLTEVARVRLHGFLPREIAFAKAKMEADMEAVYIERDQFYSTALREEYVRNFLTGETVVGPEDESRINKALLPGITTEEVAACAALLTSASSCVIKASEHTKSVTAADMAAAVSRVDAAEAASLIGPWESGDVPERLVQAEPHPGEVVSRREWPGIGASEIRLSNGMRVAIKKTDHLNDQLLVSGFAAGGLSEEDPEVYPSAMCGSMVAAEVGQFGLRPDVLAEVLAGARVQIAPDLQAFWRTFSGDQSPDHLEIALQMVYLLFTSEPRLEEGDEELIRAMTIESIRSQQRDPMQRFFRAVRQLNYGDCYYTKALTERSFARCDLGRACTTFARAFSNPAEWTVVLVGAVDPEAVENLVRKWLGGIPARAEPAPITAAQIKEIPWSFPARPATITVSAPMAEAFSTAQVTWPVELSATRPSLLPDAAGGDDSAAAAASADASQPPSPSKPRLTGAVEEHLVLNLCVRVLESRLLKLLRFRFGEIYTVTASSFFGMEAPSREGNLRGDVAVRFSCDPQAAPRLMKLALEELGRLQEEGPDEADLAAAIEVDQRAHELARQENSFWLERLIHGYKSRRFEGDVDRCHAALDATRARVLPAATPGVLRAAFRTLFPLPCSRRFTAAALVPHQPVWKRAWRALVGEPAAAPLRSAAPEGSSREEGAAGASGAEAGGMIASSGLLPEGLASPAGIATVATAVAVVAAGGALWARYRARQST